MENKLKYLTAAAILMLASSGQAGVMKCVDSKGNITFSDSGCASAKMGQHVYIAPTNTSDNPNKRDGYSAGESEYNYGYGSTTRATRSSDNLNAAQQIQARRYEDRQRIENDSRMSNFNKGTNGRPLTRAQRGLPSTSYSAPMPPSAPPNITSCDGAGCWDSQGTRYNKGGGNTYFPSTGGSCQGIGGTMQCN